MQIIWQRTDLINILYRQFLCQKDYTKTRQYQIIFIATIYTQVINVVENNQTKRQL